MSRLEELMEELCPEGVEYVKLKDAFNTKNGYTPSKSQSQYWENGTIPWFRMEDIRENGSILSDSIQHIKQAAVKGKLFPANSIIIATSATIGEHALVTVESLANQRFTYLMPNDKYKDCFDMKFIYYYCFELDRYCLQCLNKGNFASVDMVKFAKFKFPVPPLPVQREIVRILDNFTELTVELTAEFTARKKQYEYYSRILIDAQLKVPQVALRNLGKWCGGGTPSTNKRVYWDNGTIPWVSSKDMVGTVLSKTQDHITSEAIHNSSTKLIPPNSVAIVVRSGILKHTLPIVYIPFEFTVNQDIKVLVAKAGVSSRYIAFVLNAYQSELLNKTRKPGGTVESIIVDKLLNFKIPLPSYNDQSRIVSILERFDALFNDLTSGLPAEIEARKKQYEYYRDKLLTFKELGA